MESENVLVTGGAGYVGSHACKALSAAGYTPITFDNLSIGNEWAVKWGPLELGDITDSNRVNEVVKHYNPCAIMHFAAYALVGESMVEPARYYRNNVSGTINLLEACRNHNVGSFVFSSTCAIYGVPENLPITEDSPKQPVNPYGASKLMVERVLSDYEMAYGIKFAALRYFNAAGADSDGEIGECRKVETHLIPLVLDAILGRKPPIKVLGTDYPTDDGTAIRDYIHVSDLALAHVNALGQIRSGGESIAANLGTGIGSSVKQIIDTAEKVTGKTVPVEFAPRRQGDPPALVADKGVAEATLMNGQGMRNLEQIVSDAWRWHQKLQSVEAVQL